MDQLNIGFIFLIISLCCYWFCKYKEKEAERKARQARIKELLK
jgi:hypothetical protein